MKLTKRFKTGVLALLCGALCAPMAQAAYTAGDLLLSFRSTTNTANTFVVDIGQASLYRDATGTIDVTGALGSTLNAGLTAAFGDWTNDSGLYMGVLATSGAFGTLPGDGTGNASYVGKAGTGSISDASFGTLASSARNALATSIVGFADTAAGTGSFSTFVANSANAANVSMGGKAAVIATSNSNDYTEYATSTGYFSALAANSDLLVASGLTGAKLDLFRILGSASTATDSPSANGASQFQGSFSINSSGAVTFTGSVSAVPEPSRFLLLGLGFSGFLMRRRRRAAK